MTMDHAIYSAITRARQEVCALHGSLVDNGLVAWTSGNISARVAGAGPGDRRVDRMVHGHRWPPSGLGVC